MRSCLGWVAGGGGWPSLEKVERPSTSLSPARMVRRSARQASSSVKVTSVQWRSPPFSTSTWVPMMPPASRRASAAQAVARAGGRAGDPEAHQRQDQPGADDAGADLEGPIRAPEVVGQVLGRPGRRGRRQRRLRAVGLRLRHGGRRVAPGRTVRRTRLERTARPRRGARGGAGPASAAPAWPLAPRAGRGRVARGLAHRHRPRGERRPRRRAAGGGARVERGGPGAAAPGEPRGVAPLRGGGAGRRGVAGHRGRARRPGGGRGRARRSSPRWPSRGAGRPRRAPGTWPRSWRPAGTPAPPCRPPPRWRPGSASGSSPPAAIGGVHRRLPGARGRRRPTSRPTWRAGAGAGLRGLVGAEGDPRPRRHRRGAGDARRHGDRPGHLRAAGLLRRRERRAAGPPGGGRRRGRPGAPAPVGRAGARRGRAPLRPPPAPLPAGRGRGGGARPASPRRPAAASPGRP